MTGSRFRKLRHSLGLSQEDVADLAGVRRQTVSGWEKNGPPQVAAVMLVSWSMLTDHQQTKARDLILPA